MGKRSSRRMFDTYAVIVKTANLKLLIAKNVPKINKKFLDKDNMEDKIIVFEGINILVNMAKKVQQFQPPSEMKV